MKEQTYRSLDTLNSKSKFKLVVMDSSSASQISQRTTIDNQFIITDFDPISWASLPRSGGITNDNDKNEPRDLLRNFRSE